MTDDQDPPRQEPPPAGPDTPGPQPPPGGTPGPAPIGGPPAAPSGMGTSTPYGQQMGRGVILRPLGVGQTLDTAINLYRRFWRAYMGLVAMIVVPYTFLQFVLFELLVDTFTFEGVRYYQPADEGVVTALTLGSVAVYLLIISPLLTAAMTRAVADGYLGLEPSIGRSYRYGMQRLGSVLLVVVLSGLAILASSLLFLIPGLIVLTHLYVAVPAVVVEDVRGRAALSRSWNLVRGSAWRVFGTWLVAALLTLVVSAILEIPGTFIGVRVGEGGWWVNAVSQSLAQVITTPFGAMIPVLVYFDMRVRKEGLDLAIMTRDMESPGR